MTSQEEIFDGVRKIVANRLSRDWRSFKAETHLPHDLSCDSIDLVEIIMDIEDAFNLRYGVLENPPPTIGGIVALVAEAKTRVEEKQAPPPVAELPDVPDSHARLTVLLRELDDACDAGSEADEEMARGRIIDLIRHSPELWSLVCRSLNQALEL